MLSYDSPSRQKGFSIIESLVGITVGLIVVTGALVLTSTMTSSNRNIIIETRLNQDLRASSDLIARDLRRAGYWANASSGVYVTGSNAVIPRNAYQFLIPSSCDTSPLPAAVASAAVSASEICYYIEQGTSDNTLSSGEMFGFKLTSGIIYAFMGGSTPQALTDPNSIYITQFKLNPTSISINLSANCTGTPTNPPTVVVREFEIELRGHPPSDTTMIRAVRTNVRVRNDAVTGSCS